MQLSAYTDHISLKSDVYNIIKVALIIYVFLIC